MALRQTARLDRILAPVHRWVWADFDRRVRKLIAFSKVEGDGGRDILRAAELTPDPLLRRLYLEHAIDELFHMNYTYTQLARIRPEGYRGQVWLARMSRLWKRYLRLAAVTAGAFGLVTLTTIYFLALGPFAWLAKRAERREALGWMPIP